MPRRISVDNQEPDPKTVMPVTPTPIPTLTTTPAPAEPKPFPLPVSEPEISSADQELKEKSGSSILTAFAAFPKDISFAGKHDGEEIVLLLRAHIITNVPWVLITLALLVTPLIIFPLAGALGLPIGPGTGLALFLLWYLATFTHAFINFLYWYFNVDIITNERVVDIDWKSITHREVTMALISKIQDVTPKQIGVLASIFDFGSVYIQTAGTEANIEFLNIPHSQLAVKKLQGLMQGEHNLSG